MKELFLSVSLHFEKLDYWTYIKIEDINISEYKIVSKFMVDGKV